jgi:hypothetical protein
MRPPPTLVELPAKTSASTERGTNKGHSCKPLKAHFRAGGFEYRQIAREGNFAIYEQTWKGNRESAAFEVVRIRRHKGFKIRGNVVEPHEVYPKSRAWGTDGFTLTDKDAAFAKLREISR